MNISKIGFGTYRVSIQSQVHESALRKALKAGINLIDTSANYMDGEAEELIGKVMKDFDRKCITIVSKFGYIQGQNMERYYDGFVTPETVEYHPDCFHSIHPDFMRDQLTRSLTRLQISYIDFYLLHNPEYYLMHTITSSDENEKKKQQTEMLRRISEIFIALELEVKNKRINSYGISSNSFAKTPDDPHFLPYTQLIEMAEKAAKTAGNAVHSFRCVQMPGNLLEKVGLENCATWAHNNKLMVLINRPLNAYDENGLWRLATTTVPPQDAAHILQYLREKGFSPGNQPLEEYALKFLVENPNVDCVLLGMRQERYVECAVRVLKSIEK